MSARVPGPAEYSKIETNYNKGPSFGAKHQPKTPMTPGPGAYEYIDIKAKRPATGKASFSQTRRPDLFRESQQEASELGPGGYEQRSTFDENRHKGPSFGGKRKQTVADTPGPGAYIDNSSVISMVKSRSGVVKMGTSKRPDNFTAGMKDAPGPGGYEQDHNTIGKTRKGATMGGKYKQTTNLNPGPGQYDGDKLKTVSHGGNKAKIGTTKRKDIFGADKSEKTATPGPGHHGESYSSFGAARGVRKGFGNGRQGIKNDVPGPGSYENQANEVRPKTTGSIRIGSASRKDIWKSAT